MLINWIVQSVKTWRRSYERYELRFWPRLIPSRAVNSAFSFGCSRDGNLKLSGVCRSDLEKQKVDWIRVGKTNRLMMHISYHDVSFMRVLIWEKSWLLHHYEHCIHIQTCRDFPLSLVSIKTSGFSNIWIYGIDSMHRQRLGTLWERLEWERFSWMVTRETLDYKLVRENVGYWHHEH